MPDFQDHCIVRPDLPGHGTTRATEISILFHDLLKVPFPSLYLEFGISFFITFSAILQLSCD